MSLEIRKNLRTNSGGRFCCVVGCNSRSTTSSGVSFYKFRSKPWEIERRKKWITSVRRLTESGKPWQPNNYLQFAFRGREKIRASPSRRLPSDDFP